MGKALFDSLEIRQFLEFDYIKINQLDHIISKKIKVNTFEKKYLGPDTAFVNWILA